MRLIALSVVLLSMSALAHDARVELIGTPSCFDKQHLSEAFVDAREANWQVLVRGENEALLVTLSTETGRVGSRTLRLDAAPCDETEKSVILLLRAWASRPPAAEVRRSQPESLTPAAVHTDPNTSALPKRQELPSNSEVKPPTDVSAEPARTVSRAAEAPSSPLRVALTLRGAGFYEGGFGAGGSLSLDVGRSSGLGALLEFAGQSSTSYAANNGTISVSPASASLLARWAFVKSRWSFTLGFGPRLYGLFTRAQGFTENKAAVIWSPALALSLDVRLHITPKLFVALTQQLSARFFPEVFAIQGLGQVGTMGPWGGMTGVGVGWNFL